MIWYSNFNAWNHCVQSCCQGRSPSPTKLSSTWQIRSDSARMSRPAKAGKSNKTEEQDKTDILPAVASASSISTGTTLSIHPEIRTGNDVVEFYAKYGQDSPIKFFYCNRYSCAFTNKAGSQLVHQS